MKRWGVALILVLAFCGLADSLYLAQHEASAAPLICNVQSLSDCNTVANSQYSRIFGIPVAELGILFYGCLFALAAFELFFGERRARRLVQGMALIGLLVSLYSTFIQFFIIKALCVYCLASAAISVLIFLCAIGIEPIRLPRGKKSDSKVGSPVPPLLSMPPAS